MNRPTKLTLLLTQLGIQQRIRYAIGLGPLIQMCLGRRGTIGGSREKPIWGADHHSVCRTLIRVRRFSLYDFYLAQVGKRGDENSVVTAGIDTLQTKIVVVAFHLDQGLVLMLPAIAFQPRHRVGPYPDLMRLEVDDGAIDSSNMDFVTRSHHPAIGRIIEHEFGSRTWR